MRIIYNRLDKTTYTNDDGYKDKTIFIRLNFLTFRLKTKYNVFIAKY